MTEPLKLPSRSILTNYLQLYRLGPIFLQSNAAFIILIANAITGLRPL